MRCGQRKKLLGVNESWRHDLGMRLFFGQLEQVNQVQRLSLTRLFILAMPLMLSPIVQGQTLGEALNATNLTWTTSGNSGAQGWRVQGSSTHDGVLATASGSVNFGNQSSTVQTTVTGPGTLSFWWRNPSGNRLSFIVGSTTLANITSFPSWEQEIIYLQAGMQTLKWVQLSLPPPFGPDPFNYGYLDELNYTPGETAPTIMAQPPGQSQVPGLNATFNVGAGGTPPLSYQWQFNEADIPGATGALFTVTNVQTTNLGLYRVIITNGTGSIVSSNAPLEFGEVAAWGLSQIGQTAVAVGATNIVAIAGGNGHSLALRADGSALAWGWDQFGQATVPPSLTNLVAIAAGATHSLALRANGTVIAWGSHDVGETNVPLGLTNVVAIAAGNGHNLALKADGTVTGWGWNSFGQTNVPAGLTGIVAVAASYGHSLALNRDGVVVAWGNNDFGRTNLPRNVTNVLAIESGDLNCLAIRSDGIIASWGYSGVFSVPVVATNVVAVETDYYHSLALREDGTVVAWGASPAGVTNVPLGLSNVVAIAAGRDFSLALVGRGGPSQGARIVGSKRDDGEFTTSLQSQSGRVYALEYKDSLSDTKWTASPLVAGNGGNLILTDPSAMNAHRFYRVRRW